MKNQIYNLNVPKSLRRSAWIRDHDFDPWFKILTWATGVSSEDKLVLKILLTRIKRMYIIQGRRRNLRFVFSYLKEVYTICTSIKVQSPYIPKLGVRVGVHSRIPLIIPGRIRKNMLTDRRLYITTMTILGIHRIIPWWPEVDLKSIVSDFNGRYQSMASDLILRSKLKLCALAKVSNYRFTDLKARSLFPQSSGPNMSNASWGVFLDTIGLVKSPGYLWILLKWFVHTGSWGILASFLPMVLLATTLYLYSSVCEKLNSILLFLISYMNSKRRIFSETKWWKESPVDSFDYIGLTLLIGLISLFRWFIPFITIDIVKGVKLSRLSVVYNTAGKARVIGITNYWVQVALFPLHKEIFKFLRKLPTDGTFNQLSPVWALPMTGKNYFSFDLTAATDRLPRLLQRDVLRTFVGDQLSDLWMQLVDMPFTFEGQIIRYSVGQPMGAYSSWAMLALTHHFIVQSYYSHVPERDYAILGDDVIVPEYLANHYQNVMASLGVSISLPKSIISNKMIEFAKRVERWTGKIYLLSDLAL
jgi:hypothetical protein